jgi:predicted RNA-binding protein with PUA-like domain
MKYWLVKSEPNVFSIDDLKKNKKTHWDGVRNYQARNFMKNEMKAGDKVLFYHSNAEPTAVTGIAEVIKEGYADHTQFNPDDKHYFPSADLQNPVWFMIDIKFLKKFKTPVTLQAIKQNAKLKKMRLIQRGNRLSVMPVEKSEFDEIVKMGNL